MIFLRFQKNKIKTKRDNIVFFFFLENVTLAPIAKTVVKICVVDEDLNQVQQNKSKDATVNITGAVSLNAIPVK